MDFTFKLFSGFLLSLGLLHLCMPFYIKLLINQQISQTVSEYALEEFKNKAKTPIMGGLLFVVLPILAFIIVDFGALVDNTVILVVFSYVLFCLVGFLDDLLIIVQHDNKGLSPKVKLIMEAVFVVGFYFIFKNDISTYIDLPLFKFDLNIGILLLPLMLIMFLGEANAVNFTDGMDGLCAGVSFIANIGMVILCIKCGREDLAVLLACVMGGLLGYLRFNWHPAKIFMGDSGSLALGGLFASVAFVLGKEIALLFIGGVFLCEMMCVVIQQVSVRLFHKRVFKYTPIHYAFVLKGIKETKVVKGFYVFALICTVIGTIIGLI